MKTFWDTRYDTDEFVYGKEPNGFFASELEKLNPGNLLLPGEGEGRNAIHAALKGWKVDAFDQSRKGAEKALAYASEMNVHINYSVCGMAEYFFKPEQYDAVGLIFFHLGTTERILLHSQVCNALKTGGTLILEAYHTTQLGNSTGGPQSLEMLFNEEMLVSDFSSLKLKSLEQCRIFLEEGPFHQGMAEVIRYTGRKSH